MDPNLTLNRVLRLARLDTTVFDEVRDDPAELLPAIIVAVISSLLAGLGAFLYWQITVDLAWDNRFMNVFLLGSLFMALVYGLAALVIYLVLVQIFRVDVDLYALVRCLGYAAIPLALSLLMVIPVIYPLFSLAPLGLLLVFMIYAVQSATNADSNHVVIASFAGFAVMCLVLGVIAIATSVPNAPAGAGQFSLFLDLN
jgi:hypothetical protein